MMAEGDIEGDYHDSEGAFPVSYTHLDVYKRQVQVLDICELLWQCQEQTAEDVYKRQYVCCLWPGYRLQPGL